MGIRSFGGGGVRVDVEGVLFDALLAQLVEHPNHFAMGDHLVGCDNGQNVFCSLFFDPRRNLVWKFLSRDGFSVDVISGSLVRIVADVDGEGTCFVRFSRAGFGELEGNGGCNHQACSDHENDQEDEDNIDKGRDVDRDDDVILIFVVRTGHVSLYSLERVVGGAKTGSMDSCPWREPFRVCRSVSIWVRTRFTRR